VRAADIGVVFVHGHLRIDHIRLEVPPALHRVGHGELAAFGSLGVVHDRSDAVIEEVFLHHRHEVIDVDLAIELDTDLFELGLGGNGSHVHRCATG
jgi:hypothetical protein